MSITNQALDPIEIKMYIYLIEIINNMTYKLKVYNNYSRLYLIKVSLKGMLKYVCRYVIKTITII